MRHGRCGGVALRFLLRLRIPAAAAGAQEQCQWSAVLGMCARAARGTPPLPPFFVVNAATFGRVNAYARWSLVQLKLSSWVLACAFYGLLVSYKTLDTICLLLLKLVRRVPELIQLNAKC